MTTTARTSLTTLLALATAAALFLVGGSSLTGCLWDSDTLRTEATGAPGMVETIVGRFDRYPPLYYEMHLERVATELDADPSDHPKNLAAYDDAGVACDRLGRHDEAIEWMSRKRTALDALPASEDRTEHEYRYLPNLGTFHAHRWLAAGADRSDMADIEVARDLIAQAIELNPDAHFGRERYQLMALAWILEPTGTDDGRYPFGPYTSILDRIHFDDGWPGVSYNGALPTPATPTHPRASPAWSPWATAGTASTCSTRSPSRSRTAATRRWPTSRGCGPRRSPAAAAARCTRTWT